MRYLAQVDRKQWCQRSKGEAAKASLLALALAFLIRYLLHPFMDDGIPTFTFLLATFFISFRYGYKWALFELVSGFFVATYFFVKPYNSFVVPHAEDLYRMLYFFTVALVVIFVFEKTNRDRYEAACHAKEADERYTELVRMDRRLG